MKKRRRRSPEQIAKKLREADAMLAAGKPETDVHLFAPNAEALLAGTPNRLHRCTIAIHPGHCAPALGSGLDTERCSNERQNTSCCLPYLHALGALRAWPGPQRSERGRIAA